MKEGLWFREGIEPITFVLKPGQTLRAKVINRDGEPIPGVWFALERWRTQRLLPGEILGTPEGQKRSDAEGRVVWESAPADEIVFDLLPRGDQYRTLRHQSVTAADAEYTFTLQPSLKVSGTVVDAKTGQPIPEFQIAIGYRFPGDTRTTWQSHQIRNGRGGAFEQLHDDESRDFVIKIEAAGYAPNISREILLSEEEAILEFALEKAGEAAGLNGIVLGTDGQPVLRATVAMARWNQMPYIQNGALLDGSNCLSARTDSEGRFTLPLLEEEETDERLPPEQDPTDYKLFVLHPSGFAQVSKVDFEEQNATITLAKWGRVEGTVYVGSQPGNKRDLSLNIREEDMNWSRPRAYFDYRTTSDTDGKFVFENVPPGKATASIIITWGVRSGGNSRTDTHGELVELISGETATVKLGGTGRPIIGKLTPPDDFEGSPDWNFGIVHCVPTMVESPEIWVEKIRELKKMIPENIMNEPDIEVRQHLFAEWEKTEEGKKYVERAQVIIEQQDEFHRQRRDARQRNRASAIEPDGTFRIEDAPAGEWTLEIKLYAPPPPNQCGSGGQLGSRTYPIVMPEILGGQSDEPLNVGMLVLEQPQSRMRGVINVGTEAQDFELQRLVPGEESTETIKLSDYRGKTVVLDFWATWCGPCLAQLPELVKFYETIKENPNAVLLGISIDHNEKTLLNFLAKRPEMAWAQLRTDPNSPLAQQYGIVAVPTLIVIDPEGNVLAINPNMRELERFVQSR